MTNSNPLKSRQEEYTQLMLNSLSKNSLSITRQWDQPIGTQTRHFIIDSFLNSDLCNKIYRAFPTNGDGFFSRESFRERKKTSANLTIYNQILTDITYSFQDYRVIDAISNLVGFVDLEPDPKLYAGGLSMMLNGDFLNPHIDNSHDMSRTKYRRLNLLYYVTPNWSSQNGGSLELWDDQRRVPKEIPAFQNRLVVMETNNKSWHSVNKVNSSSTRCCVSNYFFSIHPPHETNYFHVTSFSGRPNERFKRVLGWGDNLVRNYLSKVFKVGRGKKLINPDK